MLAKSLVVLKRIPHLNDPSDERQEWKGREDLLFGMSAETNSSERVYPRPPFLRPFVYHVSHHKLK